MKTSIQFKNDEQNLAKKKKRKKIALTTVSCVILLPLLIAALSIGIFAAWANTQHIDKTLLPTATAVPVFYDSKGNVLPYAEDNYVEMNSISDNLKNAFVALEDKRFYSHKGYDIVRMGGALVNNIKARGVREGASTITQQLVKNTHLTHERTLSRKLKELAIAIKLEKQYGKDEIMAMYLSVIYFGSGAYGVKQAANVYFGKSVEDLTLAECATLAGLVKNPSKYSPINHPEQCEKRRNIALSLMLEQGYISEDEYEYAKSRPVQTVNKDGAQATVANARACEFYLSQAQKEVCDSLGITKYQLGNSGLKIYTNLDVSLQYELERQRAAQDNYESSQISSVSIILDNANGAVLAHSSSYPYAISRQAGSVLKPLAVYAPAIDRGLVSLATPIVDEKVDFSGFSPNNFGGLYYGDTTVRDALKKSMNSVSVKVMDYLGVENSAQFLQSVGIDITEEDKNYALALGATSQGVSPLLVAAGYSAFARQGEYLCPSYIRYVVDNGNKTLSNEARKGRRVTSASTSALMTVALTDTVKDGTAKSLSVLPFEVAAKTGTAQRDKNGNSDAWCSSYNGDYTVLVWHGSDSVMQEKGGGYPTRHAAKIWKAIDAQYGVERTISVGEIVPLEIDTYSTKCNRQVTAATENTPVEYRKIEFFAKDSLPDFSRSKFENLLPADFDVVCNGSSVNIAFDTEPIYCYEIVRTDATGSRLIYHEAGSGERAEVCDLPIGFGGKVDYTLICHLINNEEICASKNKSVYIRDSVTPLI